MMSKLLYRNMPMPTTMGKRFMASAAHGNATGRWKAISLFVAIPCIILMSINVGMHMKHEWDCPSPRPPFIAYDHLRIRNKRFPWGDGQKSLFHNPHLNALPDGYEDHGEGEEHAEE